MVNSVFGSKVLGPIWHNR